MEYGINHKNAKHGMCTRSNGVHPFYRKWRDMQTRCKNPNFQQYRDYGGRGIKCLWPTFESFKEDMFESFEIHFSKFGLANTTLDRIDVNGSYSKENCRWATRVMQRRNSRQKLLLITWNDKTQSLFDWSKELGLNYHSLHGRVNNYGYDIKKAFTKPMNKRTIRLIEYRGDRKPLMDWVREKDLNYARVKARLNWGWTPEEAFEKPAIHSLNTTALSQAP